MKQNADEMSMEEFLEGVRRECWAEDTSFQAVSGEDGGTVIEEHVWSLNSEHVRAFIRIGADGKILSASECRFAEDLKNRGVRII